MRRRNSRATSSCRVGAVRTCNRTVVEERSKLCTPRIRGPSTSVCDQAGSPRKAAAAVSNDVLILKYDVETGDDVTYKVLRAETERKAGQARQRCHRRNVDAELRQS